MHIFFYLKHDIKALPHLFAKQKKKTIQTRKTQRPEPEPDILKKKKKKHIHINGVQ
jgi:hypothetical protein